MGTKVLYTIVLLLLFIIVCAFIFFRFREYNKAEPIYLPITNKVIGIDPGHGGVDPGAVSKGGIKEDDINLKIALKLKRFVEHSGGVAILTRNIDEGLYTENSKTLREMKNEDLKRRKEIIDQSDCDIFVTIHLNSFTQHKYYGAQTFYNEELEESKKLAYIIQDELKNILDKENNRQPSHRDDVYLLKEAKIPSVLIEAGFLSNPEEERLLNTSEYQEKIAWSIYAGIMKYFSQKENL